MTVVRGTDLLPRRQQQIIDHIYKADVVPVDFRVLTPENQEIFTDFINTLTLAEKAKILIVR